MTLTILQSSGFAWLTACIGWAIGRWGNTSSVNKEVAAARSEGYAEAVEDYRKLDSKRRATLRVPLPKPIKRVRKAKKTKKRRR